MNPNKNVLIIGAGLSGLTLAYNLSKLGIEVKILEGSDRIGGRIHTIRGKRNTPLELGATWLSEPHSNLLKLIKELKISVFPQFSIGKSLFQISLNKPIQEFNIPDSESSSFRIVGGTGSLIEKLKDHIGKDSIHLSKKVVSISDVGNQLLASTSDGDRFRSDKVVLCLPPQLISKNIDFSPRLPEPLNDILPSVQTWMAGSLKFVLEYERPFWRENGFSGMFFSHSGIITEMYDHLNYQEDKFGFTGFLNPAFAQYTEQSRKEIVIKDLERLFGTETLAPLLYLDKSWDNEFIIGDHQIINIPHLNNGHELFKKEYYNDKLFFAGTETSNTHPGYMEGAINSANTVFNKIRDLSN